MLADSAALENGLPTRWRSGCKVDATITYPLSSPVVLTHTERNQLERINCNGRMHESVGAWDYRRPPWGRLLSGRSSEDRCSRLVAFVTARRESVVTAGGGVWHAAAATFLPRRSCNLGCRAVRRPILEVRILGAAPTGSAGTHRDLSVVSSRSAKLIGVVLLRCVHVPTLTIVIGHCLRMLHLQPSFRLAATRRRRKSFSQIPLELLEMLSVTEQKSSQKLMRRLIDCRRTEGNRQRCFQGDGVSQQLFGRGQSTLLLGHQTNWASASNISGSNPAGRIGGRCAWSPLSTTE